jgi:hypothetical protein
MKTILKTLCITVAALLLAGSAHAQRFHFLTVRTNDFVLENQGTNLFSANTNLLVAPLLNHFLTPSSSGASLTGLVIRTNGFTQGVLTNQVATDSAGGAFVTVREMKSSDAVGSSVFEEITGDKRWRLRTGSDLVGGLEYDANNWVKIGEDSPGEMGLTKLELFGGLNFNDGDGGQATIGIVDGLFTVQESSSLAGVAARRTRSLTGHRPARWW